MKRQPRYKFIVHWFFSPRDSSGNVYSYGCIVDTKSGRCLRVKDVPESNLRGVIYDLNGKEHKQNYWWAATQVPQRELFRRMNDIPYVSDIPAAFRKLMKSRVPGAGLPK